jgi:hypothetical protein
MVDCLDLNVNSLLGLDKKFTSVYYKIDNSDYVPAVEIYLMTHPTTLINDFKVVSESCQNSSYLKQPIREMAILCLSVGIKYGWTDMAKIKPWILELLQPSTKKLSKIIKKAISEELVNIQEHLIDNASTLVKKSRFDVSTTGEEFFGLLDEKDVRALKGNVRDELIQAGACFISVDLHKMKIVVKGSFNPCKMKCVSGETSSLSFEQMKFIEYTEQDIKYKRTEDHAV